MADTARIIGGSVTAPRGFRAGSTSCGIKSDANTKDLAALVSDVPCVAAATFTTSKAPAAPVLVCKEHLVSSGFRAQGVLVNSGNENCSTGERGMKDARTMAGILAQQFHFDEQLAMVSSTGIIGRFLPIEKIISGAPAIDPQYDGGEDFAGAIITTDTHPKKIALEFLVDNKTVRIGACVKGAGMIYPNMATMLCYITTDAAIEQQWLQETLRDCVEDSFNMIAVDGDMSTNDTVLVLANGMAGNTPIAAGSPDAEIFAESLRQITKYLAMEIARDGEGATKLMEVRVSGAATDSDARKAARAVTVSPLWQCALAGSDPNWGRIIAAVGASGAVFDHNRLEISLGHILVVKNGLAADYAQADAKAAVSGKEVIISVNLHNGVAAATAWGCDLTHGYIDENTTYTR